MTVGDLKGLLEFYDDDLEVVLAVESCQTPITGMKIGNMLPVRLNQKLAEMPVCLIIEGE